MVQAVSMGKRAYPLDLENIGGDVYSLMSKGHHDQHDFMRQVRADGCDWPLGMPKHIWLRCIPPPEGYSTWYVEAKEGARGAFPATQCWEAWRDETYEAIVAAADRATAQGAGDHGGPMWRTNTGSPKAGPDIVYPDGTGKDYQPTKGTS